MLEEKAAMNINLTTCEQGMDGTKGGAFTTVEVLHFILSRK